MCAEAGQLLVVRRANGVGSSNGIRTTSGLKSEGLDYPGMSFVMPRKCELGPFPMSGELVESYMTPGEYSSGIWEAFSGEPATKRIVCSHTWNRISRPRHIVHERGEGL